MMQTAVKYQSWAPAVALREARDEAFARVQRMVHEGVHALRALPPERRLDRIPCGLPEYLHEANDHGAYEEARWRPTPEQIDWGFKIGGWYGTWRGRDRRENGLHRWEWLLLETRGWQAMFGRESWSDVAERLNAKANCPSYDRVHWRRLHNSLIETALNQAIKLGDIVLDT